MSNRFKNRPLSFSQLNSWEHDKEQWYDNYVLGNRGPTNHNMRAGNIIGDSIGTPNSYVPALQPPGIKEFKLDARLGDIWLVGYADHFCPTTLELHENKTSTNPKRWTQGQADKHKQLTMYSLMLFLKHNIPPEEVTIYLNFIPLVERADYRICLPDPPTYRQFPTRRTSEQIAEYAEEIEQTVAEMEAYIEKFSTVETPDQNATIAVPN